jgi:hypothetical protein
VEKYCTAGQAIDGACAFHAGYLSLQTHNHNMKYLLFFHYNNGSTNATQYYVIRVLLVLLFPTADLIQNPQGNYEIYFILLWVCTTFVVVTGYYVRVIIALEYLYTVVFPHLC